ncbi:restriction endonuclease subunit S [Paraburkholderia sp. RL17-381-BIF-C]|uniref:restriction endonuclease subunit S n=1 Tax=Paraburkholderia sp. RL17-381-BIF-C TaxID=3031635 RepID=UPI0038BA66AB
MTCLPNGWMTWTIADLGGMTGGKTPSKAVESFWSGGAVPWVSPKDMKVFDLKATEDTITDEAVSGAGMALLPPETVLMVTRSGILAHSFPVAIAKTQVTINQDIKAVKPSPGRFLPRYLAYNLRAQGQTILSTCAKAGTTVASVDSGSLERYPFPFAPLPEQKRIADKLDTILARVDACRGRLDRASDKLRLFRKSVLHAAVSGQLSTSCGGDGKHTWTKARAADVCAKVQSGGTPKSGFVGESGIPFLKVYNIVDQQVAFDYRPQFVTAEVNRGPLAKSVTLPGDVLMNIVGPPLGKVAVVPYEYDEWNINQAITLFRPSEKITTGWLYILLCHGENIRDIVNETKGSAGQVNISLSQCRDFLFPVPSIDEQNKIVRKVGELFSLADEIEKRLVTAEKSVERLTPALLAKAFRGELVPQDPTDEPASELLKRLAKGRLATGVAAKSSCVRKASRAAQDEVEGSVSE